MNRFSDRQILRQKCVRILDLASILQGFVDLINTDCGFCLQFSSDPGL